VHTRAVSILYSEDNTKFASIQLFLPISEHHARPCTSYDAMLKVSKTELNGRVIRGPQFTVLDSQQAGWRVDVVFNLETQDLVNDNNICGPIPRYYPRVGAYSTWPPRKEIGS